MTDPIRIAVNGAAGRMGRAVLRAVADSSNMLPIAALVRPSSPLLGQTIAELRDSAAASLAFVDLAPPGLDVLIDFSTAMGFDAALALARTRRLALVSGTTGLSTAQLAALRAAAQTIPVLWAANFSLGVALLTRLAREAAAALPQWDCEISEAHHRHKQDAPSGTALSLGEAVANARGGTLAASWDPTRVDRSGARRARDIGFSVVRGGDIVGDHSVLLIGTGERIELSHRAQSRSIFAAGAARAAAWISGRAPGMYSIENVLGLSA